MKFFYTFVLLAVLFLSCNDGTQKTDDSFKSDSVGNINSLQIVMPNNLWNGAVGEKVREHFAAPTDGLPQDEPLFSMNQISPETFTDFARLYRNFLYVNISKEDTVSLRKNPYAKPQIGAFVKGTDENDLLAKLDENAATMIDAFKKNEIEERQRRTRISMMKEDSLQETFGITMQVPAAYRIARAAEDFIWLRKDLEDGTTNIIVYEVPLSTIGKDSTVADIIKMRDTIGSALLPVEDNAPFITEAAYAPYLFNAEIDGKFAYETKGTWELKDAWMAGPFINYAVRDEENNRYLILEGFTYAPAARKRDLQFELESILKSTKFK